MDNKSNIFFYLDKNIGGTRNKKLFINRDRDLEVSRQDFFDLIFGLSGKLKREGFERGDTLALVGNDWAQTQLEYAVVMYSVWSLYGVLSIHCQSSKPNLKLTRQLKTCNADFIFTLDDITYKLEELPLVLRDEEIHSITESKKILDKNRLFKINKYNAGEKTSGSFEHYIESNECERIATVIFDDHGYEYDKLMVFTHKNLICGTSHFSKNEIIRLEDKVLAGNLSVVPTNYGFNILASVINNGGTYISTGEGVSNYLHSVEESRADKIFCKSMSAASISHEIEGKYDISTLKKFVFLNTKLRLDFFKLSRFTLEEIEKKTDADTIIIYGIRESSSALTILENYVNLENTIHLGRVLPNTEFKILNNGNYEGRKKGKICFRGCQTLKYCRNKYEESRRKITKNDWIITSNTGFSHNGNLFKISTAGGYRPLGGTKAPGVDNTY